MTRSTDSWQPDTGSDLSSVDQTDSGITDVHSGSEETGTNGQSYSTW
jgi:general secretion pathway protein G